MTTATHRLTRIARRLAHLHKKLQRSQRIDAAAAADAVSLLDQSHSALVQWLGQGQAVADSIGEALEALRGVVTATADSDRSRLDIDLDAILADTRHTN